MFQYLSLPLTLSVGTVEVYHETMHLRIRNPLFDRAARFRTLILALDFAEFLAAGIVMEFEFGTK